ncbi:hypothetical protein EC991_011024 [Linnemannia zychae]|nr:hypothetical protein EC991_011024 [Linnemannia zychae]
MFEVDNFISFHDLSPNGTFIWTSPSVTAILGYEHEEIEGVPAYDVMHKDDIAYCRLTHQENVLNDMVGTQIVVRFKHKDGSYVPCMVIFSVCFDYIVTCSTVIDTAQEAFRKVYTHSAAMTSIVGSRHKEFERIKRHHRAFDADTWNPNTLDPEPRACMILNRFSRSLGIMYASPSCQLIFKIDPDQIIGKPLLVFLRADDLAGFVEQAELAKSSNVVTHMRFWFQSPNCREEIPCEAMMFGAADGLVAVLRLVVVVLRQVWVVAAATAASVILTKGTMPRAILADATTGTPAAITITTTATPANATSQPIHFKKHTVSYPQEGTIPTGGVGYTHHSSSNFRSTWFSTKTIKSPLQGIPIGSINSIRNLDKDQQRIRPLRSLQEDSLDIVDSSTQLPPSYRLRTHHAQVNGLENAELDLMMSKLDTGYGFERNNDDDDDDEDDDEEEGMDVFGNIKEDDDYLARVTDCHGKIVHGKSMDRCKGKEYDEIIEMDMQDENVVMTSGNGTCEIRSDLTTYESASASTASAPPSVKARRRQPNEEDGYDNHDHHRFDGSPVPKLQVGSSMQ